MDITFLLSHLSKHIRLAPDEQAILAQLLTYRKYKKGQYLIHEGSVQRKTHFIQKGSARAYYLDAEGYEHVIQLAIEGWWISDIHSFIKDMPAMLHVQALEDTELWELSHANLELLYEKVPQFERYFRIVTQNAFASFQRRMLEKLSMDAEARYLAFAQKYPEMNSRLPQKVVASYLGMSAEFISKIKKRIAQKEQGK